MPRRVRATLTFLLAVLVLISVVSIYNLRGAFSIDDRRETVPIPVTAKQREINFVIREQSGEESVSRNLRHISSVSDWLATDSILFPDWEVLLIVLSGKHQPGDYTCVFQNNDTSMARAGSVLSRNRTTFMCVMPMSVRRMRRYLQPKLIKSSTSRLPLNRPSDRDLIRWTFMTYESYSTEDDVVVFAKGVNNRQGKNRPPSELNCVFLYGDKNVLKTAVTVSAQEVFRCPHPSSLSDEKISKVSIEIVNDRSIVVPTVAYYSPYVRKLSTGDKAQICTCTMVFNVAKVLREWVTYHSSIGIDKFFLYDNGSEDDLGKVIEELRLENHDIQTPIWPWPKTQEAGFSHCAMYAKDSCKWMSYIDVDEFIFSPSWLNSSNPSKDMLGSLLPKAQRPSKQSPPLSTSLSEHHLNLPIGEISIQCNEFGPSDQAEHPPGGVMQGYTCRRRLEQRHKSIVRLDAVDDSLLNVIHHFQMKEGYRVKSVKLEKAVVNHYKYQAWPEFKAKFRRRVSAYVVDWKNRVNPSSKDRTPGLGFKAVEPVGWAHMFCEVRDNRLRNVAERWFGVYGRDLGLKMDWQL